jgi:hypothetical protein
MTWEEYLNQSARTEPHTDNVIAMLLSGSISQYPNTFYADVPPTDAKVRLIHGAMGLSTEVSELRNASGHINYLEERGDCFWYLALLCRLVRDLRPEPGSKPATIQSHFVLGIRDYRVLLPEEKQRWEVLANAAACLLDYAKRYFFYNSTPDWHAVAYLIGQCIDLLAYWGHPEPGEIFDRNIAKLRKRFPNRFDTAAAVNRNLDSERDALKGDVK